MKYLKTLFILILLLHLNSAFAQNNYSNGAIQIYNSGIAFHKQGKYELAEQKYNQALKLQPNFVEAKKNLAIIYHNRAIKYYSDENYNEAIEYAKKSLNFNPDNMEVYRIIGVCYSNSNNFDDSIAVYKKIISHSPDDDSAMESLAQVYIKTKQYEKASELYTRILQINPNDKVAQQNIKYVNYCHTEKVLNESINNLSTEHNAPCKLYRLIKPAARITDNTVERMKTILDLVWSEPNGQAMLQALINKKVPINITQGTLSANATKQQKQNTLYIYGFIPVYTYKTSALAVNIPFNYISNFNDPNLPAYQRVYNLQVFVHEFGHTYMNTKNPDNTNSIEEELGVSMIGYNVAHKIITGKYLNREQTESYSMSCLESLLSDEHRNLPVYSNFNRTIQYYGIAMPYPEVYSNLPLMYKKLLSEGKISPVPNFYVYGR